MAPVDESDDDVTLLDPYVHIILTEDVRLQRLMDYVKKHFDERLTASRAAELVGLERTYFSRYFRKATGMTFSDWNEAVRLERAAKELASRRGRLVRAIAFSVGYPDVTTFERAFKKRVGLCPTAYRATRRASRRSAR